MELQQAAKIFQELTGASVSDTTKALVTGEAMTQLLDKCPKEVAGAALGIALGKYVRRYGQDVAVQEKVVDAVLAIAVSYAGERG